MRLKALQAQRKVEPILDSSAVRCDKSGNVLQVLDQLVTEQPGVDNKTVVGSTEQHEEEKIDDVTFLAVQGAADNNAGLVNNAIYKAFSKRSTNKV